MTESNNFISGYAIVEGQTESDFFGKVLNPYFNELSIHIEPIVIRTSATSKGGAVNLDRLARDYNNIAHHPNTQIIAMCLDFHALPGNFPGYQNTNDPVRDARSIEAGLKSAFKDDFRLFPYIQLHDFEALLFSDVEGFQRMGLCDESGTGRLKSVLEEFASPEHINHGQPPAHRIKSVIPSYRKRINGPTVAQDIGLEKIRSSCYHFAEWFNSLVLYAQKLQLKALY